MLRCLRFMLMAVVTCFAAIQGRTQGPPCPAGTLANVLGTSCSVGAVTFNFENHFLGGSGVFEQNGTLNETIITPAEIGFTPITQDGEVGFKLTMNFADGPAAAGSFASIHLVTFSYEPQPNPGFDILEETALANATGHGDQGANFALADALDFQNYPNQGFTAVDAGSNTLSNPIIPSVLEDHMNFFVPVLSSLLGGGQVTQLETLADGTGQASMTSVTFLYRFGPAAPPALVPLAYSNFDFPGAAATLVAGIANTGTIAGSYRDNNGVFHGFVADNKGNFSTIDFPNASATFGGAPNDRGDLVGTYIDDAGNFHGFSFEDQEFTPIDFPGAILTQPAAINDQRQIVGIYGTPDQGTHGFLLDRGEFISIDHTPPLIVGGFTFAFGIDNRSEIVGTFLDPFSLRGLTQISDAFQIVDVPGQTNAIIEGINDAGEFVGTYTDFNFAQHGFVSKNGLFGTVDFPGGTNTAPVGINGQGIIVGEYSDASGNPHSFMAQPNHGQNTQGPPGPLGFDAAGTQAPNLPICGSAEWLRHPEQIRNFANCQLKH